MASQHHRKLMGVLNKMAARERWRKMPQAAGKVTEKSLTKSGNIKLTITSATNKKANKRGTKTDNATDSKTHPKAVHNIFYILKRNSNLYQAALAANPGDHISAVLRTYLGKKYCVKLAIKERTLENWSREGDNENSA